MPPIIIGIVILSATGIFFNQHQMTNNSNSNNDSNFGTAINITTNTSSNTSDPKIDPTDASPSASPIMDDWQYSSSTKAGSEGETTVYQSNDDPDMITNWYKDRITNLNMSVKNFITTKNNEQVLNKLETAQNNQKVSIEISKNPGNSQTKIKVLINS
jgi:hypothetical protein